MISYILFSILLFDSFAIFLQFKMKLLIFTVVCSFVSALQTPVLRKARSSFGLTTYHNLTPVITQSNFRCRLHHLHMVDETNQNDTEPNAIVTSKNLDGRKERVALGYKISSLMYAMFGMFIFTLSKKPFYASGPLLASGLSYILIGATESNVRQMQCIALIFYHSSPTKNTHFFSFFYYVSFLYLIETLIRHL